MLKIEVSNITSSICNVIDPRSFHSISKYVYITTIYSLRIHKILHFMIFVGLGYAIFYGTVFLILFENEREIIGLFPYNLLAPFLS